MKKMFKFKSKPELSELEGLQIDGATFKQGKGTYTGLDTIVLDIPNTFRFTTQLEVAEDGDGNYFLITSQLLTRWAEMWEMEDGFSRVGFRNPEIREQMEKLCVDLIGKGLAEWIEYRKQYFDKNENLIEAGMKLRSDAGEVMEVFICKEDDDEMGFKERPKSANTRFTVNDVEYFPLFQFDLNQWEIVKEHQ